MDDNKENGFNKDITVLPADNEGPRFGWVVYEQIGPIGCSQSIWDSMSKEEQESWKEMNRKIIEDNRIEKEKFMKERALTKEDFTPLD